MLQARGRALDPCVGGSPLHMGRQGRPPPSCWQAAGGRPGCCLSPPRSVPDPTAAMKSAMQAADGLQGAGQARGPPCPRTRWMRLDASPVSGAFPPIQCAIAAGSVPGPLRGPPDSRWTAAPAASTVLPPHLLPCLPSGSQALKSQLANNAHHVAAATRSTSQPIAHSRRQICAKFAV